MSKELFITLPSLRIGKIVEVSGNQIRIELKEERRIIDSTLKKLEDFLKTNDV